MGSTRRHSSRRLYARPWLSALVIAIVLFVAFTLAVVLPGLAEILGYFLVTVVLARLAIALLRHLTRRRRDSSA